MMKMMIIMIMAMTITITITIIIALLFSILLPGMLFLKVPEDVYTMFAKCWQATPTFRMGWEKIKINHMVLRQIKELTLQEKAPPKERIRRNIRKNL